MAKAWTRKGTLSQREGDRRQCLRRSRWCLLGAAEGATTPEQVGTIVGVRRVTHYVGRYSVSGQQGTESRFIVWLIDRSTRELIWAEEFHGTAPPREKPAYERPDQSGPEPEVAAFLARL